MKPGGSLKVILAALIGNSIIAVAKFTAATFTGSSAMFSEAIHSVVDTGNQGLLLFGMHRAKKPADKKHPFGYGGEIYFWAFVVAVLIFAVGAGFSIYEGIHKLQHPEPLTNIYINYIVLGFALVVEGAAWWVAFKEFNKERGRRPYFSAVQASKDPRIFTILFEDSAAMLGLLVALVGVALTQATGLAWIDGAASIVIGLILAGIAAILAYECKGLLIGEGASDVLLNAIKELLANEPAAKAVNEVLTLHFGPDDVLLTVSLDFNDNLTAGDVERTTTKLEQAIKSRFPVVKRVFIEAQSSAAHQAAQLA